MAKAELIKVNAQTSQQRKYESSHVVKVISTKNSGIFIIDAQSVCCCHRPPWRWNLEEAAATAEAALAAAVAAAGKERL